MSKHDQYIIKKYEDYDWECWECKDEINPIDDSFDIAYSDDQQTKSVMYCRKCVNKLGI